MSDQIISSLSLSLLNKSFTLDSDFLSINATEFTDLFSGEQTFKTKFYTLLTVQSGTGNLSIDHISYLLKKGRIFFINYNQILQFSELDQFTGEAVLFTRSFYNLIYTGNRKIKDDTAFNHVTSYVDFNKNEFADYILSLNDIKKEYKKSTVLSKEIICLLLKVSMLKYIRKTENLSNLDFKSSRKSSYIENFAKLVDLNFKELKRTSDYAKLMHISANYLNSLVKEKLDISAESFIQNRVILEAERLLLNTTLSVTEISYELGFSDKSHFGKYFKKINTKSPNNFRKQFQESNNNF